MKPIYKILIFSGIGILVIIGVYFAVKALTTPISLPGTAVTPGGGTLPTESGGAGQATPGESQNATGATQGTETGGGTTQAAQGTEKISKGQVFYAWGNNATGEVYYFSPEGKVFTLQEGSDSDLTISDQVVTALNSVEIAPGDQKTLAAFGDPNAPQLGIFDIIDKTWRPLPTDIVRATWGVRDDQLIATVKSGTQTNLVSVDLSKKNPPAYKIILRGFRMEDTRFVLLSPQALLISELSSAAYAGRAWKLDLKTLAINLLLAPENGLSLGLTKDKSAIYKSGAGGFFILDRNFAETTPVFFNTLSAKCAGSASTTYCFAPEDVPSNISFPDDYFTKKFFSVDDLYVVDMAAGSIKKLFSSNLNGFAAIDAKNPFILNGELYFVNRYDNYLYEYALPTSGQ